jgi:hypothetical protein
VIKPSRSRSTPSRIIYLGNNLLEEETLGIISELVKAHSDGSKDGDVNPCDILSTHDKKGIVRSQCEVDVLKTRYT